MGKKMLQTGRGQHKRKEIKNMEDKKTMRDVQGSKAVGVLAGESSKVGLVISVLRVLMMLMPSPHALLLGLLR